MRRFVDQAIDKAEAATTPEMMKRQGDLSMSIREGWYEEAGLLGAPAGHVRVERSARAGLANHRAVASAIMAIA